MRVVNYSEVGRPRRKLTLLARMLAASICIGHGAVLAEFSIKEDFTQATTNYKWKAFFGACLTAGQKGDQTGKIIPACDENRYFLEIGHIAEYPRPQPPAPVLVGGETGTIPDLPGHGALRLTNGDNRSYYSAWESNSPYQIGGVVTDFPTDSSEGIRIKFTTVTYGGNGYGAASAGGAGLSFFVADASVPPSIGGTGAALGYSCGNVPVDPIDGEFASKGVTRYDGVRKGYFAIGIDEQGHFADRAFTTNSGLGFMGGDAPLAITLRGSGDTNWPGLQTQTATPSWYSNTFSTVQRSAIVRKVCATGRHSTNGGPNLGSLPASNRNYPMVRLVGSSVTNQQSIRTPKRIDAIPMTFDVVISKNRLLSITYSQAGGSNFTLVDGESLESLFGPVPPTIRFGFAATTGPGDNVHEITCFKTTSADKTESSVTSNVQTGEKIQAGTQVYLAYYHPFNSWGQLTSNDLLADVASETVSIRDRANWDAHCVLSGGACAAMGGVSIPAQTENQRKILTWDGASQKGIPFQFASMGAERNALTLDDPTGMPADARIKYLRGSRTLEGGQLRARTGVLGDIVGSSPVVVGIPNSPYPDTFFDALSTTAGSETSYGAFKVARSNRQSVVYVGANDGLLHGFRAGGTGANGEHIVSAGLPDDGVEVIAYMPAMALATIHPKLHPSPTDPGGLDTRAYTFGAFDFSSNSYSHNFHVDGTPGTGDLYYKGAWHTWLVAGMGAGGGPDFGGPIGDRNSVGVGSLFALDITAPESFSETPLAAAARVIGDWSSTSPPAELNLASSLLSCTNVTQCNQHLGSQVGAPLIKRMHDGNWAVLFGNGLNSASGAAGLFIMSVNATSGEMTTRFLNAGATSGAPRNGIANVTPVDLDNDHTVDFVYAGDALGNLWRFDLVSSNPANWAVSSHRVFRAPSSQPITTQVVAKVMPAPGTAGRLMLNFGTGRHYPQTLKNAARNESGQQALYGVWDTNMKTWNDLVLPNARFASTDSSADIDLSWMQPQTITEVEGGRTVSTNPICWDPPEGCSPKRAGWTIALPEGESVVYSPTVLDSAFVVNTNIAAAENLLTCAEKPPSGHTLAVDFATGGAHATPFFDESPGVTNVISGKQQNAVGTPWFVSMGARPFMISKTVDGKGIVTRLAKPTAKLNSKRVTWRAVR